VSVEESLRRVSAARPAATLSLSMRRGLNRLEAQLQEKQKRQLHRILRLSPIVSMAF
jgi:hypothetical protein